MSLVKPSGKTTTAAVAGLAGGFGGAAASRAVYAAVNDPEKQNDPATASSKTKKIGTRVAIAAVGIALAAAAKGDDLAMQAARGAGLGMAVMQVVDGFKDGAETSALATNDTPAAKIAKNALGLGCNCSGGSLGARRGRRRGMNAIVPAYDFSAMDRVAIPADTVTGGWGSGSNPLVSIL